MTEFTELVNSTLKLNVISKGELRALAGKANHVATLIYAWRPFLDQLWAAISDNTSFQSACGKLWARQILSSLTWLQIFLQDEPGMLVRRWKV